MKIVFMFLIIAFCASLKAQKSNTASYIKSHYTKEIHRIPMRDGTKLHTIVYSPKDTSKTYPFLMQRTCYSIQPYKENKYRSSLGPSKYLMKKGYIFVYQDVRGRYMSEGSFDNMRPHQIGNDPSNPKKIDESSDTYDTIDWLLKNIQNNNGKVGQWGISYPGFYTAAALPEAHPALKASSPQAPISDFFFDDFHHMGAFLQSYLMAFPVFGHQKTKNTTKSWYSWGWDKLNKLSFDKKDAYSFHLELGTAKNISKLYNKNFFWKQIVQHPNYDDFWSKRSILPHLKEVDHAVMTVGGWFDAEDLYGPLNIYKELEKNNPGMNITLVMGPWSHGDWSSSKTNQIVNHIWFGKGISEFYQKNIELAFFEFYLKDQGTLQLPEAYMFDTGLKRWETFDVWPPIVAQAINLGLGKKGQLLIDSLGDATNKYTYISDPQQPVPFRSEKTPLTFTPRRFMTDDQRHASKRKDVLCFETPPLEDPIQLAGEIIADLNVIVSTTDADFIVKIIDVYPEDEVNHATTPSNITLAGYQQLVRHEVFRGRFRDRFSVPKPFEPNKVEKVRFPLQDILHTFKKGHKIMIQIHSTWFPYIDRNPQQYIPNMYKAKTSDYIKSTIHILGDSKITIGEKHYFKPD